MNYGLRQLSKRVFSCTERVIDSPLIKQRAESCSKMDSLQYLGYQPDCIRVVVKAPASAVASRSPS
jgi:hypothetical protein